MKITVRKIAEEAGVSPASVSRYINGSEDVSSEIASKVESALFSLGGSPVVRRPRKQIILILLPICGLTSTGAPWRSCWSRSRRANTPSCCCAITPSRRRQCGTS